MPAEVRRPHPLRARLGHTRQAISCRKSSGVLLRNVITLQWARLAGKGSGATVAFMPQRSSIASAGVTEVCNGVAPRQRRHRLNGIAGNA
jgi:hypothetical protein